MSLQKKIFMRKKRRSLRTRNALSMNVLRVSVFRSLNHMYAQVIDVNRHMTLASCSTLEFRQATGNKKEQAFTIGRELAKRALDKGIKSAIFDRGSFLYHGRVKAVADGLREGGMQI